jgi:tRNA (guanine-N7-)-methyltransferase
MDPRRVSGQAAPAHRPVRSFVLREGRMTAGQRRAYERLWPRFGLDPAEGETLDPAQIFGNPRPTRLEIGFGNGEALVALATADPECNFLGVEMHRPGVGHLLLALERQGIDNLRVLRRDATELLHQALPAASLDGVYLFFPDPWPKQRHHKRRIVQPPFLADLARVLRPGGSLHMATDWEDYAQHMLTLLEAAREFDNTAGPGRYAPRPQQRPLTRFERRGRRLGHGIWDLVFRRAQG